MKRSSRWGAVAAVLLSIAAAGAVGAVMFWLHPAAEPVPATPPDQASAQPQQAPAATVTPAAESGAIEQSYMAW